MAELRRENGNTRLQLFWKDYSVQSLQESMRTANKWDKSPKCNCLICAVSGRKDEEIETDKARACAYIPWFEELIDKKCGLKFAHALQDSTNNHPHMSNTLNGVLDVDCHFVKVGRGDWLMFTYGKKLYQAQTVDDPELKKLEKLFQLLHGGQLALLTTQ
jgi:hypothetical protein